MRKRRRHDREGIHIIGTAAAILGAVGAGTSLLGGIFGRKAAKSAAELQAEAAAAAGRKVEDATATTNLDVQQTATDAGNAVRRVGAQGAGDVNQAAVWAKGGVDQATQLANAGLDPYAAAGKDAAGILKTGIAPGGDFNKTPTMADIQIDPGYAFRMAEGQKALERSAAAHGAVGGGGFLKDLTTYSQGTASQEYAKAFDRFEKTTQDRFSNVFKVSQEGQTAADKQGANLIGGAKYGGDVTVGAAKFGADLGLDAEKWGGAADIGARNLVSGRSIDAAKIAGDYATQGANAQAAGQVAGSNALWGGIGGAANSATSAWQYDHIMNNPSSKYNLIRNPNGPIATPPFIAKQPYGQRGY